MSEKLKKEIEQLKLDLCKDGFVFANRLGAYESIEGDDILGDSYYDGDALAFADKLLDLLYNRVASPVPNKESNNGENKQ